MVSVGCRNDELKNQGTLNEIVTVGHICRFQSPLGILSLGHVEGEWLLQSEIGFSHAIVTPSLLSCNKHVNALGKT